MPLVLKHSWKRREGRVGRGQRVALGHYRLPRPQRSHTLTHAEFRAAGSGGGEGVCFPPGPGAPHLVLGEAELHDPLGHLRGAPGQEGEGGPRPPRTVGLELRPLGRPRPHGPRARLHRRRPQAAAVARPSGPTFPWQPPLPGGGGSVHPVGLQSRLPPAPGGSAELVFAWLRRRGGRLRDEHRGTTLSLLLGARVPARLLPRPPPPDCLGVSAGGGRSSSAPLGSFRRGGAVASGSAQLGRPLGPTHVGRAGRRRRLPLRAPGRRGAGRPQRPRAPRPLRYGLGRGGGSRAGRGGSWERLPACALPSQRRRAPAARPGSLKSPPPAAGRAAPEGLPAARILAVALRLGRMPRVSFPWWVSSFLPEKPHFHGGGFLR